MRKALGDDHFPAAEPMVLVCDNLNTHTPKSLYKAFDTMTADRLAAKLAWPYTPPHGSWLNLAEIARSGLARPGRPRRLATPETVAPETAAWVPAPPPGPGPHPRALHPGQGAPQAASSLSISLIHSLH